MANRHRGEIAAQLDGKAMTLCLTLGALAELEDAFGEADMLALAERFEAGRLSASDAVKVIGAGLRGAGHDIDDGAVAMMRCGQGAAGYVDIVARLLTATFGTQAEEASGAAAADVTASAPTLQGAGASGARRPFPGAA